MILSMTGFAAASADLPGASLAAELRSVNHRYLDLSLKLGDELRPLEPALRERLAGELKRGKVELKLVYARTQAGGGRLAFDPDRVAALAAAAADVARQVPGATPLTVAEILRWPGVVVEPAVDGEALAARASALVGEVLRELAAARAREGAKLAAVLLARCDDIEREVARVVPRLPAVQAAWVEKSNARLREAGVDPASERVAQELALFLSKIDVGEELARLTTHVAEVRRILAAGGAVGKRLDFLAQELHREANTLGSKSVDADVSRASLEMKVAIEQMREQVQNLE